MRDYKKDFPIFQKNKKLIYLDSAATSQKPQFVLDAVNEYYATYNANVKRGIYPIAEKATAKVEEVRKKVAKFINAKYPEEIIFVRNTTEAINLVANVIGKIFIKKGDTIATTIMEHHSNFVPWQQLAIEKDSKFAVLDIDENFNTNLSFYAEFLPAIASRRQVQAGISASRKISKRVWNDSKKRRLLAITNASNVLGSINPIREIVQRLTTNGQRPLVVVDGAQSVPHMKIDVRDLDCDFLAFSGHKMMASTGIGVLYGKKELLQQLPPFLYGGEMIKEVSVEKTTWADLPHKYEAGTPDIAGIVSLGAAIDYLENIGMDNLRSHEKGLTTYAIEQLQKIPRVTIYGPLDTKKRGGAVSFTIDGIHPHDIAQILGDKGICIRAGHHCAMPLHKRLGISASARASFYVYNDESDVDALIKELKEVKKVFFS